MFVYLSPTVFYPNVGAENDFGSVFDGRRIVTYN